MNVIKRILRSIGIVKIDNSLGKKDVTKISNTISDNEIKSIKRHVRQSNRIPNASSSDSSTTGGKSRISKMRSERRKYGSEGKPGSRYF